MSSIVLCKIIIVGSTLFFCVSQAAHNIAVSNSIDFSTENRCRYSIPNESVHNPDYVLNLPKFDNRLELRTRWHMRIGNKFKSELSIRNSLSVHDGQPDKRTTDNVNRKEYYLSNIVSSIDKMNIRLSAFNDYVIFLVGKALPEFGVAYIYKQNNFLYEVTHGKSKYLIDILTIFPLLSFEAIYAPDWSFLPDDYSDKKTIDSASTFFFGKVTIQYGTSYIALLLRYAEYPDFALNYSVQIGQKIILYTETSLNNNHFIKRIRQNESAILEIYKNKHLFFKGLLGLSFTPASINWTFYLEACYNGDGFSKRELKNRSATLERLRKHNDTRISMAALQAGLESYSMHEMSKYGIGFHVLQNEKWFNRISMNNTLFVSFPLSFMNIYEIRLDITKRLKASFNFEGCIGIDSYSEFDSSLYRLRSSFILTYSFAL